MWPWWSVCTFSMLSSYSYRSRFRSLLLCSCLICFSRTIRRLFQFQYFGLAWRNENLCNSMQRLFSPSDWLAVRPSLCPWHWHKTITMEFSWTLKLKDVVQLIWKKNGMHILSVTKRNACMTMWQNEIPAWFIYNKIYLHVSFMW